MAGTRWAIEECFEEAKGHSAYPREGGAVMLVVIVNRVRYTHPSPAGDRAFYGNRVSGGLRRPDGNQQYNVLNRNATENALRGNRHAGDLSRQPRGQPAPSD